MTQLLKSVPIFVMMVGLMAAAMFAPAFYAWTQSDLSIARSFLYSGLLLLLFSAMLALASTGQGNGNSARDKLFLILATFTILPLVCAIPFNNSIPDTGLFNAWWEMVSSITTTGATLYEPSRLPQSLHLWRTMVGWFGGFFMLVLAIAVLAPLRLGGFEIFGARESGAFAHSHAPDGGFDDAPYIPSDDTIGTNDRIWHYAGILWPAYMGVTAILWVLLMITGVEPFVAACLAMSTISTSGIVPLSGNGSGTQILAEIVIFLFLILALSRRFWPGGGELRASKRLSRDPELLLGGMLVVTVTTVLFLRHWLAALDLADNADIFVVLRSIWGALFTSLSFLTTTGFESSSWGEAREWSGLGMPGMVLAGLAIIGGGVATTTGGIRLLRIYALLRQNQRELHRLIQPASVAGGGSTTRWLRREGAYVAWIFVMLFAMTLTVAVLVLTFLGQEFEPAVVMVISALSNVGQLAAVATEHPIAWTNLGIIEKAVLAFTMVLGRIEILAIVALVNPDLWRS